MSEYTKFIPQNIAPLGMKRICVYNENGKRVGQIPLGTMRPLDTKQKLYSFGALSDIHLQYNTAQDDFRVALSYLNDTEDVEFTCICGDLTSDGLASQLQVYKNYIDAYSPDTPVYAIGGNHDAPLNDDKVATQENLVTGLSFDALRPYTGQGLYYSFTHGDDVFIMVGEWSWSYLWPFSIAEMQWLYEILEANRNKRCFVFQHLLSYEGSGNPYPGANPGTDILGCENTTRYSNVPGRIFLSLMRHYKNCIWFHGHSHTSFDCHESNPAANYDQYYGIHSVHIPSLAAPRWFEESAYVQKYAESEGYVVDVYQDGIHLRGRDFVNDEFHPFASLWLSTVLETIPEKTYVDKTETLVV